MSQLPHTPRRKDDCHRYKAAKTLMSCGIPCAVWAEDLLIHFGVPTVIFDNFVLVVNPEAAASRLETLGYNRLPQERQYKFMKELTRDSVQLSYPTSGQCFEDGGAVVLLPANSWHFSTRLLSPQSDIIPPLPAVIGSYIDVWLDAEALYFSCHLMTHMGYLAAYVKETKDPSFLSTLRYKYQQDFWLTHLNGQVSFRKQDEWRRLRESELSTAD